MGTENAEMSFQLSCHKTQNYKQLSQERRSWCFFLHRCFHFLTIHFWTSSGLHRGVVSKNIKTASEPWEKRRVRVSKVYIFVASPFILEFVWEARLQRGGAVYKNDEFQAQFSLLEIRVSDFW